MHIWCVHFLCVDVIFCVDVLVTGQDSSYRMAGNIGGELNLAIWRSNTESPNFNSPNF